MAIIIRTVIFIAQLDLAGNALLGGSGVIFDAHPLAWGKITGSRDQRGCRVDGIADAADIPDA